MGRYARLWIHTQSGLNDGCVLPCARFSRRKFWRAPPRHGRYFRRNHCWRQRSAWNDSAAGRRPGCVHQLLLGNSSTPTSACPRRGGAQRIGRAWRLAADVGLCRNRSGGQSGRALRKTRAMVAIGGQHSLSWTWSLCQVAARRQYSGRTPPGTFAAEKGKWRTPPHTSPKSDSNLAERLRPCAMVRPTLRRHKSAAKAHYRACQGRSPDAGSAY